jgi:hypothetical protein
MIGLRWECGGTIEAKAGRRQPALAARRDAAILARAPSGGKIMRIGLLILGAAGALMAAAPANAAQRSARSACVPALRAEPDAASFTAAGRARGPALAQAVGANFSAAAASMCASGALRAGVFAPYRRLLVRNAEGADNPNIYDDSEEQPGALIIEYAFAGGPAPSRAAIEAALRCWRNPEAAGCSAEDVGP